MAEFWTLGILAPMQSNLKPPAIACKILASIEAVAAAWFLIGLDIYMLHATSPPRDATDWGTPGYYHRLYFSISIVSLLALLVVVPNRWLVFSRVVFGPSLIVALLPFCFSLLFISEDFSLILSDFFGTFVWWAIAIFLSAPWPLSLIFSRMRFRRGEIFTYA
jgi:hypothetical protein